jgi:hypothetical protein
LSYFVAGGSASAGSRNDPPLPMLARPLGFIGVIGQQFAKIDAADGPAPHTTTLIAQQPTIARRGTRHKTLTLKATVIHPSRTPQQETTTSARTSCARPVDRRNTTQHRRHVYRVPREIYQHIRPLQPGGRPRRIILGLSHQRVAHNSSTSGSYGFGIGGNRGGRSAHR